MRALKLKQGIHAPGSTCTSHVWQPWRRLAANDMAKLLHRRLHIGLNHRKLLGELTSDVPDNIRSADVVCCPHCTEANAARLPHTTDSYQPSHAGRLAWLDIAGPFKNPPRAEATVIA